MTISVKLKEIVEELEMLPNEYLSYLNRSTGELIFLSLEERTAVEEEYDLDNYPGWQRKAIQKASEVLSSEEFIRLPDKFEIHEYATMKQFCLNLDSEKLRQQFLSAIRGSGAFRRFKAALHREDIAEDWYRYR